MSRIGKRNIIIPAGVAVGVQEGALVVKGPKGELRQILHPRVTVAVEDKQLKVAVREEKNKKDRALWGTFNSLLSNLLIGVTSGFKKQLVIDGVGYKAALKGDALVLSVGFSHPVEMSPLPGIVFTVDKNIITVEGIDKQAVGEMAARIRSIKKPEPYKGKGIRYIDEVVRRKEGKTAAKSAAA